MLNALVAGTVILVLLFTCSLIINIQIIYSPFLSESFKSGEHIVGEYLKPRIVYVCSKAHEKECNLLSKSVQTIDSVLIWVETDDNVKELLNVISTKVLKGQCNLVIDDPQCQEVQKDSRFLIVIMDFSAFSGHNNRDSIWLSHRHKWWNLNVLYGIYNTHALSSDPMGRSSSFLEYSKSSMTMNALNNAIRNQFIDDISYPASTYSAPNKYSINLILATEQGAIATDSSMRVFQSLSEKLIKNVRYIDQEVASVEVNIFAHERFGLNPFYKSFAPMENNDEIVTYVDYEVIGKYLQSKDSIFKETVESCPDCKSLYFVVYMPASTVSPFRIIQSTKDLQNNNETKARPITAVAVPDLCSIVALDVPSTVSNQSLHEEYVSIIQSAEYYMVGHLKRLMGFSVTSFSGATLVVGDGLSRSSLPATELSSISSLSINNISPIETLSNKKKSSRRDNSEDSSAEEEYANNVIEESCAPQSSTTTPPSTTSEPTSPVFAKDLFTPSDDVPSESSAFVQQFTRQRYDISAAETLLHRLTTLRAKYAKTIGMLDVLIELNQYKNFFCFAFMKSLQKEKYKLIFTTLRDINDELLSEKLQKDLSNNRVGSCESRDPSCIYAVFGPNSYSAHSIEAQDKIRLVYELVRGLYDEPSGPINRFQFNLEESFALLGPYWLPLIIPAVKFAQIIRSGR